MVGYYTDNHQKYKGGTFSIHGHYDGWWYCLRAENKCNFKCFDIVYSTNIYFAMKTKYPYCLKYITLYFYRVYKNVINPQLVSAVKERI